MLPSVSPAPKKTGGCATAALILLSLVILSGAICSVALFASGTILTKESASATASAVEDQATQDAQATQSTLELTPTPYPPYTESHSPSGATFEGSAQQIILNAQVASEVNSQHEPTELQSIFSPNQTVYLDYQWAYGHAGYVYTVWYFNGSMVTQIESKYIQSYNYGYGYTSTSFTRDGQGAIEVYLCGTKGCNDRKLAWIRPFTISG